MSRECFRLLLLPLLLLIASFIAFPPTTDASTSFQSNVPHYEPPGLHPFLTQTDLIREAILDPFGFPTSSYVASTHDLKSTLFEDGVKRSTLQIPFLQTSRNAEIQPGKIRNGVGAKRGIDEPDLVVSYNVKLFTGIVDLANEGLIRSVQCLNGALKVEFENSADGLNLARQWVPGTRFVIKTELECASHMGVSQNDTMFGLLMRRSLENSTSHASITMHYEIESLEAKDMFLESDIEVLVRNEASLRPEKPRKPSPPHLQTSYRPSNETLVSSRRKRFDIARSWNILTVGFNYNKTTDGPEEEEWEIWKSEGATGGATAQGSLKCYNCYFKFPIS